jgi:hypothetical protein
VGEARAEVAAASAAAPPQLGFGERARLALTQALVEAAEGHVSAAKQRLAGVVADGKRARCPELELEARLALLQVQSDRRRTTTQARALSVEARRLGLLLLAKKASMLASAN